MKFRSAHFVRLACLCSILCASVALADDKKTTTTTTTTTTMGTVGEISPNTIVVNPTSGAPGTYSYSRTTTYVDENGNPVAIETVKSGAPVTVYYDKEGNKMTATRVVVKKRTVTTD